MIDGFPGPAESKINQEINTLLQMVDDLISIMDEDPIIMNSTMFQVDHNVLTACKFILKERPDLLAQDTFGIDSESVKQLLQKFRREHDAHSRAHDHAQIQTNRDVSSSYYEMSVEQLATALYGFKPNQNPEVRKRHLQLAQNVLNALSEVAIAGDGIDNGSGENLGEERTITLSQINIANAEAELRVLELTALREKIRSIALIGAYNIDYHTQAIPIRVVLFLIAIKCKEAISQHVQSIHDGDKLLIQQTNDKLDVYIRNINMLDQN